MSRCTATSFKHSQVFLCQSKILVETCDGELFEARVLQVNLFHTAVVLIIINRSGWVALRKSENYRISTVYY